MQEGEEDETGTDIFSNHSLKNKMYPDHKNLIQTRGKIQLMFTSELRVKFLERVEDLKR